ncbi:hypothetical protein KCTC52924_01482 [Arenibacter antarcticus]|uniref:YncE family protein n=1 Tax=Arenibacter antarcticus TaxID=2040469 RepID=A0ABW5VGN6_9FLAO|nr:YncE family protein [Arenibacter sp. H213]MCM4166635.1 hypothetical protein [Arenibacter sp. H213]
MIKKLCLLLVIFFGIYSCQTDDPIVEDDIQHPGESGTDHPLGAVKGFYLLNEGNMSMNKASLDYMDYETGAYKRNIFSKANPNLVGGLGDVGNSMGIYGSKLYVVVNASNKVEVLNIDTGARIKQIDIDNGRHITFYNGKAYLSSYLGSIGDPNAPKGIVAEIDTTSLKITRRVEVGRQPEELAAYNGKIYVANSGGYSPPDYESTISVIDINNFTETKRIDVAVNLHRLNIDSEGDLYVTSRGDYYEIPSKLFVIDTKTEAVKKSFDIGVSDLTIHNDIAYMYSTAFSYISGDYTISYRMLDTRTETFLETTFIPENYRDLIEMPYGIAVHPETGDVLITDAKDYVTPGTLYCFTPDGGLKWSVETGDIPAHIAFKHE